jgi:hypothetical protein
MREFSKPSELVQKQQPGSVRRMLFRLLFLFLLLKGFGRFAAFHLAELFLTQLLLLGFILTKVGPLTAVNLCERALNAEAGLRLRLIEVALTKSIAPMPAACGLIAHARARPSESAVRRWTCVINHAAPSGLPSTSSNCHGFTECN